MFSPSHLSIKVEGRKTKRSFARMFSFASSNHPLCGRYVIFTAGCIVPERLANQLANVANTDACALDVASVAIFSSCALGVAFEDVALVAITLDRLHHGTEVEFPSSPTSFMFNAIERRAVIRVRLNPANARRASMRVAACGARSGVTATRARAHTNQ